MILFPFSIELPLKLVAQDAVPYALYFASHYYLYGTITNAMIVFFIHTCEGLVGHALIHKNIIKNEVFNKVYSRSHSVHHVNPHSNYTVGWCIIWDLIFGTYG